MPRAFGEKLHHEDLYGERVVLCCVALGCVSGSACGYLYMDGEAGARAWAWAWGTLEIEDENGTTYDWIMKLVLYILPDAFRGDE